MRGTHTNSSSPEPEKAPLPEAWRGGGFGLCLAIPQDVALAERLLQHIWSHPDLRGPYRHRDRPEPYVGKRLTAATFLYGRASTPLVSQELPCGTFLAPLAGDVLPIVLEIPMGALTQAVPSIGAWPLFDEESEDLWLPDLERWFAEIGREVYRETPYDLGVIGHELIIDPELAAMAKEMVGEDGRSWGILLPDEAKQDVMYVPSLIQPT